MIKKAILFILITLIIFSNSVISTDTFKSLDNYYYILTLGIDKAENDEIKITVQILENSGQSSENSNEHPILYSSTGKTLLSCISTLETSLNKQINMSHCSAIIFSNDILKSDFVSNIIATLGNNSEIRNTTYIFSCNQTAFEFLETISNSKENFTANTYERFLDSSYDIGYTEVCTFGKLFSSSKRPDNSILIPYINLKDEQNSNKKVYQINGSVILKNNKYIANLSPYECLYINILSNSLKSGNINIPSPFKENKYIDLQVYSHKRTQIKTHIINNSPYVEIKVFPEFLIKSSGSNYNYLSEENVIILESSLKNYLEKDFTNICYKITKELNTDLLSLKDLYKTNYLTYDEFNKLKFSSIYQNTSYKITVYPYIVSSNLFNKQ